MKSFLCGVRNLYPAMWVTFFLSKREETIGWRNPNLRWQIAVGGSWHFKGWKSQLFPVEWTWEKQTTNKNALSICNFQILSDVFSKGKKQLHGEPKQNCPVCLLLPFFCVFSNSTEKRQFVQIYLELIKHFNLVLD